MRLLPCTQRRSATINYAETWGGAVNPEVARWPCVSRLYFWGALLLRPKHAMEKHGPISSVWVERRRILNILWWYDLQAGSTSESNTAHSQALPKGVCLGACSSWTQAAMNMQLAPNQRRKLGDCKPSHLWGLSFGAMGHWSWTIFCDSDDIANFELP